MPSLRLTYFVVFVVAAALMAVALYMQYVMDLMPCALCITQRVFIIGIGVVALVAAIHNPRGWGRWVYALLGVLNAIGGAAIAGRQLWLQNLPPDKTPACGPSVDYILETFPLRDALALLFRGDGNCAEVVWTFLGLSIPGWTFIAFVGFTAVFLWQAVRRPV